MLDNACNAVTCLRPTSGGLHFGHYIGNIQPLIMHQYTYNCFFIFADLQALNMFVDGQYETIVLNNIYEMMKQILSLGVDENKVYFARESKIKNGRFNEFVHLCNFLTNNRINRLPAFKSEKTSLKMSQYLFPILQMLDFVITDAAYAFSNIDNKPVIELTNEVFAKCNAQLKTNYKHISLIHGTVDSLIGIDGFKMSKKRKNCIFLKDTNDEIIKKTNKLYTDPCRIHSNIQGNVQNNNSFKYLRAFMENDIYEKYVELYEHGDVGDVIIKEVIAKKLISIADASNNCDYSIDRFEQILSKGEQFLTM